MIWLYIILCLYFCKFDTMSCCEDHYYYENIPNKCQLISVHEMSSKSRVYSPTYLYSFYHASLRPAKYCTCPNVDSEGCFHIFTNIMTRAEMYCPKQNIMKELLNLNTLIHLSPSVRLKIVNTETSNVHHGMCCIAL